MTSDPTAALRGRLVTPARIAVQWLAAASVLLVLAQATLAGHLLTGQAAARDLHGLLGTEVFLTVSALHVGAAVVWRVAHGPTWPVLATAALFALTTVQSTLGWDGRLALHVPTALLLLLGHVGVAQRARRPRPLGRPT